MRSKVLIIGIAASLFCTMAFAQKTKPTKQSPQPIADTSKVYHISFDVKESEVQYMSNLFQLSDRALVSIQSSEVPSVQATAIRTLLGYFGGIINRQITEQTEASKKAPPDKSKKQ